MSHLPAHLYHPLHLHRWLMVPLLLLCVGLLIVLQRGDTVAALSVAAVTGGGTPTATGTVIVATATPTQCVSSGGTPVAWATAGAMAQDYYGSGATSNGINAYSAGGYSFSTGQPLAQFSRYNPAANAWTSLPTMPQEAIMPVAVYAPNVNKIYVMGGQGTGAGATYSINRVYDVASGTWSLGAAMPGGRSFAMGEYYNGKIYVIGGYSDGQVTSARTQVWEYDPIANTWNTTRANMPNALGGAGHGIIDGKIYIAGGRASSNTVVDTLYAYDVATNTWATLTPMPSPNNGPGSAVLAGKLWVFGGGNPFLDSPNAIPGAGKSTNSEASQATDMLRLYDPIANSWSSGPSLTLARSFPGGTAVGQIVVAWGGNTGGMSTNSTEVNRTIGGGCGTPPTLVPTNTATSTRPPTGTRTPTPPPGCGEWAQWPSPTGERLANTLYGVAVASPNEVWAVGDQADNYNVNPYVLIEVWDGTAWSRMPISSTGQLRGVAAAGPDDVWAVGNTVDGPLRTLTMHWNGSTWSTIASPNVPNLTNNLYAVAAASPNDVWAVGSAGSNPLALRWNGSQWNIVPTPEIEWGILRGLAVVGPNDVWAVGSAGYGSQGETLVLHWDGSAWNRVYSPNQGLYTNSLQAISVISPNNIWAAGWYKDDPYTAPYQGTILHWDGTDWSNYSISGPDSPDIPSSYQLFGISMASSTEGWAVGWGWEGSAKKNLFARWDGSSWTRIEGLSPNFYLNELFGVATVASGEAWAVGTLRRGTSGYYDPQILRYGPACGTPTPAASITPTTVQITGTPLATSTATATPISTSTSVATSTAESTSTSVSTGTVEPTETTVAATNTVVPATPTATPIPIATSTSTATVVPTACPGLSISGSLTLQDPTQAGRLNTLLDASTCADPRSCPGVLDIVPRHYDAYTFRNTSNAEACFTVDVQAACLNNILIHSSAYLGTFNPSDLCQNYLADVGPGVLTNSQYSFTVPAGQTFVVVVNELAPNLLCPNYTITITGPACPVPTTPVPTSTSILPTVTVTGVPTALACSIQFSDVPTTNAFYQQIMCLSCMGFVSGYPDGTFRPNSEITRGQLSKIVSNTGGITEPETPTNQSFEDVPVGSTFYMYIERMAASGIIAGYPCGGPGEPCGTTNRPYFRPGANATRGQISKVVSNAAGLNETPTGQSFEDVPSSHTFYLWIERLAMHNMMSGYPCGGPGEPCGTTGKPYFRPSRDATRGQVTKIAASAFYPDCRMP